MSSTLKNRKRTRLIEKLRRVKRSHYLMTTRFNDKNHNEMLNYCSKSNKINCIYGSYTQISTIVPENAIMFILEMNNDQNKIEGVGLIRNKFSEKRHTIYKEDAFNTFSYLGPKRINRVDMTNEEDEIMTALDVLCFKSKQHQKRCRGITLFPLDILEKCKKKIDLTDFIRKMFASRLENL
jgi:hypothetical protein